MSMSRKLPVILFKDSAKVLTEVTELLDDHNMVCQTLLADGGTGYDARISGVRETLIHRITEVLNGAPKITRIFKKTSS